jgi:hypothetical protein
MAVSLRTSAAATRPARAVSVKCQAGPQKALPAALATAAAASLIASPAFAGVILQQPELKKVFQEESTPAAKKESSAAAPKAAKEAPAPKAAPAPKKESYSEGGSFPNALLLVPASVAAIAGGGFALTKVDPGFADTFTSSIIKDSSIEGAGYEVALKEGGVAALKVGTKKVRGGTTKKGRK